MEKYIFGKMQLHGEWVQYLRVCADRDIVLPVNTCASHKKEYSDSVVTFRYRVVRELKSEINGGLFYKWYLVEDVQRSQEKTELTLKARVNALEAAVLTLLGGEADV